MQLLTIFAILFTIGGVMFALQNNVPVMVSFALWQFEGSLALVLLISLALGALIAALVSTPATLRMQWQISRQKSLVVPGVNYLDRSASIILAGGSEACLV